MNFREFLDAEEKTERRTWAFIHEHPAVVSALKKLAKNEQDDFLVHLGRELNQKKFDFASGPEAWHKYHAELPRIVEKLLAGGDPNHNSPLQTLHGTHPLHRH